MLAPNTQRLFKTIDLIRQKGPVGVARLGDQLPMYPNSIQLFLLECFIALGNTTKNRQRESINEDYTDWIFKGNNHIF